MLKKITYIIVLVLLCIAKANLVWACSCAGPVSPKESFDSADAVFIGHVTNLVKDQNVELRVDKVWKGDLAIDDGLKIGMDTGCAYFAYENDASYLVYAYESQQSKNTKQLAIGMCSRTKPLINGQIETRYLDDVLTGKDLSILDRGLPTLLQNGESADIRVEAVRMLNWFQTRDKEAIPQGTLDAFLKATHDPDSRVRAEVATALAFSHPRGAIIKTALLGLLKDNDEQVRRSAAYALTIVASHDSETYQSLLQSFKRELSSTENKTKNYEGTLAELGVSLLQAAKTDEEKAEAIAISLDLLEKVKEPNLRVSLIQHMGFLGSIAKSAASRILAILKETDQDSLQQYTIIALGDIGAVNAYDDVAKFLYSPNCYVVTSAIPALKKIDLDKFKQSYSDEIKHVIETKFDQCRFEMLNMLTQMNEETQSLRPFLLTKYQEMSGAQDYEKDSMKRLLAVNFDPGQDSPVVKKEESNARYTPKALIGNNEIGGMKVVKKTNTELEMEIDYNYEPVDEDWANLSVAVLYKGEYLPYTGFVPAQLVPGRHKVILSCSSSGTAPDTFKSDEVEIKMYRKKGYDFLPDLAATIFPAEMTWTRPTDRETENNSRPDGLWNQLSAKWMPRILTLNPFYIKPEKKADRGYGPGYARIGEVTVYKETNDLLELKVRYVYDPQESRFAELTARTYLAPYSPDHIRNIGVLLKPGFNTGIVRIERSQMAPAEFKTDKIRMAIVGNFISDQVSNRMAVYETFTYPKTWSVTPQKGLPKAPSDQPLEREGEGKSDS